MNENKLIKLGVAGAVIVGIGVIGGFKFFEKIDNGYVGVRYSMNGGIKDEALGRARPSSGRAPTRPTPTIPRTPRTSATMP